MGNRQDTGFALIEALVIGTIAAIVIAFAITIIFSVADHTSQAAVCGAEARQFQDSVNSYHDGHDPHVWPDPKKIRGVPQLAKALSLQYGLSGNALAHLDGSQRVPVDVTHKGWKYDFAKHTVDIKGCG
jgi:hypothetical protein